jgi:hypothetical protein
MVLADRACVAGRARLTDSTAVQTDPSRGMGHNLSLPSGKLTVWNISQYYNTVGLSH